MFTRVVEGTTIGSVVIEAVTHNGPIGRVHAIFNRSFHIVTPQKALICIVKDDLLPGPLNVTVQLPQNTSMSMYNLRPGQPVDCINDLLIIGNGTLIISLKKARMWRAKQSSPYLFLPKKKICDNINVLQQIIRTTNEGKLLLTLWAHKNINDEPYQPQTPISPSVMHRLRLLLQAISHENLQLITIITSDLAGIGYGLTPSMDDILMGVITGITFLTNTSEKNSRHISNINKAILNGTTKTTLLSQALLKAASIAEIGEPIRDLVVCILTATPEKIIETGRKVMAIDIFL